MEQTRSNWNRQLAAVTHRLRLVDLMDGCCLCTLVAGQLAALCHGQLPLCLGSCHQRLLSWLALSILLVLPRCRIDRVHPLLVLQACCSLLLGRFAVQHCARHTPGRPWTVGAGPACSIHPMGKKFTFILKSEDRTSSYQLGKIGPVCSTLAIGQRSLTVSTAFIRQTSQGQNQKQHTEYT